MRKLRGEARAAREAAEAARRALGRDLVLADVNRLYPILQRLKDIHREGNRQRALDGYPEIIEILLDIRRRHPRLSDADRVLIQRAISEIAEIERAVEQLQGNILRERSDEYNRLLTELHTTLMPELEERLLQAEGR